MMSTLAHPTWHQPQIIGVTMSFLFVALFFGVYVTGIAHVIRGPR